MSQQGEKRRREEDSLQDSASRPEKRPRDDENVSEDLLKPEKRLREASGVPVESSRPRKRPGGASRISRAEAEFAEKLRHRRAAEAAAANAVVQTSGVGEAVRQHYNAVPERGRDWRKTDSKIKGLRSFNNWVKSTVIHKFSPGEYGSEPLKVLDIGCGKGGDLQKWQRAPQNVELYIGVDPAEISIDQARERYRQMRSRAGGGGRGGRGGYNNRPQRLFDAEFIADDAFSLSLGDLPQIKNVGFGPGSKFGPPAGFDVVSMMFCMHYAFENEAKAKGMLSNVAGSLKKGGRFFGVIPNSDLLRDEVTRFHENKTEAAEANILSISEAIQANETNGVHKEVNLPIDTPVEDANPNLHEITTKAAKPVPDNGTETEAKTEIPREKSNEELVTAEWGNGIYRVRFPGETPKDGIFRPPYGWKYSYFLEEAVEEVPEYVVPWEAFRAIAEDYNLELQYRKPFAEIWHEEKNSPIFGPLSEQMGVRGRDAGPLLITDEEFEAASFYHAFCFYKL